MKHYDVSIDDGMVVDKDGSVWVWCEDVELWKYLSEDGRLTWDAYQYLEERYEPYVVIDGAAQAAIKRGIK